MNSIIDLSSEISIVDDENENFQISTKVETVAQQQDEESSDISILHL